MQSTCVPLQLWPPKWQWQPQRQQSGWVHSLVAKSSWLTSQTNGNCVVVTKVGTEDQDEDEDAS